ncbi:helicase [Desmophyllum pertusum]|uniref:Helicase n=1 Tax=Desmophyllum pertusum TaxID=174260 RepID=A0A9X0CWR5_9CNID|nr:helicase [Desmophyllum pertusum]
MVFPRYNGKIVGVLHRIISPHERQFVCKVDYENPQLMLPINKSVSKIAILSANGVRRVPLYREKRDGDEQVVKVDNMDLAEVRSGKFMFLVQYLQWRSDCSHPLGIIVRKLPQRYTLNDSMGILFAEHGVRKSFDEECRRQVRAKFPPVWSIPAEENQSRKKIDGAFTIDPENYKDLDDALTLEQLPNSVYRVGVHIADVSYFVEAGTQLDKEALFRCTSYYPGHGYQNVPMLPRELSENHCSLLPGKDRLCLSVFLDMSEEGKLVGPPQISRTIVTSTCQLTYSDAQKLIDGQESSLHQLPKDAGEKIKEMSALAQRRRKIRLVDAGCDHWSNSDDPENFEAHELVEEMMILANEEIAKFLSMKLPELAPLRTQLPPKDHKLSDWVRQYGQFIKHSLFLRGFYSEEILSEITTDAASSESRRIQSARVRLVRTLAMLQTLETKPSYTN